YRAQPIYAMIQADLNETARKGGGLFRAQMTDGSLTLRKLGDNTRVWLLESETIATELKRSISIDGAITQVKVVGRDQVIAVVKGETDKYGTLQKVLNDDKIRSSSEANKMAEPLLSGMQETVHWTGVDINTLR